MPTGNPNSAKIAGIYVIIDTGILRADPLDICARVVDGGAGAVQLRAKNFGVREFSDIAEKMNRICRERDIPFVVNDRVDVALAAGTGVHLGRSDMHPGIAKRLLGDEAIVGLSAGSVEDALCLQGLKPDYIGVGPIYPTTTKRDAPAPLGHEIIIQAKKAVAVPVVAVGGIKLEHAGFLLDCGADAIAVSSAIVNAKDAGEATRMFDEIYKSHLKKRRK